MIPSLLRHAASGEWLITPERLQELQVSYQAALPYGRGSVSYFSPEDLAPAAEPELFQRMGSCAVVSINGTLGKNLDWYDRAVGGCDYDDICTAIDAAEASGSDSIILHVRSPGGMALGAMECGDRIAAISKPTIAYTDFLACSGGYWLASQCDAIYCSASAFLGSIGVLAAYLDQSKLLEGLGIRVNAFSAGKWKLAGASFKPMTDDERAMFQSRVERYYAQFTEVVNRNRTIKPEFMEGQSMDGLQAVEAGLSDGIYPSIQDLIADLSS